VPTRTRKQTREHLRHDRAAELATAAGPNPRLVAEGALRYGPSAVDNSPYRRFLILSSPRSGTHMLRTSFDGHPSIVAHTELFNPD
jgi:hypothetical protein